MGREEQEPFSTSTMETAQEEPLNTEITISNDDQLNDVEILDAESEHTLLFGGPKILNQPHLSDEEEKMDYKRDEKSEKT